MARPTILVIFCAFVRVLAVCNVGSLRSSEQPPCTQYAGMGARRLDGCCSGQTHN